MSSEEDRQPAPDGTAAPGRRARRWVPFVIGVLLAFLAGSGGTWLLSREESADVVLDTELELPELAFPDAEALNYAEGPEAFCAAVTETMAERNYLFLEAEESRDGIACTYGTPIASRTEDGSYELFATLFAVQGDTAHDRYEELLRSADQQRSSDLPVAFGPLHAFPVGDAGWVRHGSDRHRPGGQVQAAFRSGNTTYHLAVSGWQLQQGEPFDMFSEASGLAEVSGIVTALGGEGVPSDPMINRFAGDAYPGLGRFGDLTLPLADPDRCAALTEVLEAERPVRFESGGDPVETDALIVEFGCLFEPEDGVHEASSTDEIMRVSIRVERTDQEGRRPPEVLLNGHLADQLERPGTQLYAPAAGSRGYLVTREDDTFRGRSFLQASHLAGDDLVTIEITAYHDDAAYTVVPEETMVETLRLVLEAMSD
ncbi:hypothetical protein [Streptomyces profundus]|uniref:hypothetical protein n=1 Tax=Streptomyces profundus TaxID=2867410 RepID=UPI001D16E81D|nr:hypothetical protein [Streptomyces sp. MA3_2.13]UED87916.1 hypothetical protein K4G22_30065 [Streptomyces sp. MA3_2.13]